MGIVELAALAAQVAQRHKLIVEEYKRLAKREMSTAKQVDYLKAAERAASQVARLVKMGGDIVGPVAAGPRPRAFAPGSAVKATTVAALPLVEEEP